MKRFFFRILFSIVFVVIVLIATVGSILFFHPTFFLNSKTLNFALEKTQVLEKWSWSKADINHEWVRWNERLLSVDFRDFCFLYKHEAAHVKACMEVISGKVNISWSMKDGLEVRALEPMLVRSSLFNVSLQDVPVKPVTKSDPPDVWGYWQMLWGKFIPEMDLKFKNVLITKEKKDYKFDLSLLKDRDKLEIHALDFLLQASKNSFQIIAPEKYALPVDLKTKVPIHIRRAVLSAKVSPAGIPLDLKGHLEPIEFNVTSRIDLPLKRDFSSWRFHKEVLLSTSASFKLEEIKKNVGIFAPSPFDTLPAPLNVMDGTFDLKITTEEVEDPSVVLVKAKSELDLSGTQQVFQMDLGADIPLDLKKKKPESVALIIDLKKVHLLLPNISKKRLPPQFFPDSRIKYDEKKAPAKEKKAAATDLFINLEALGPEALSISTNLLQESLRLNFDLMIDSNGVNNGYVESLPLKTTVFKRPILVKHSKVTFNAPLEPILTADIEFPLPEYRIFLKLEGPLSDPRYVFSSKPQLPQDDIYAVLLFGRPLSELDPEDSRSAKRTNKILSQGILSLSVLYFLAGSPVQSLGYDPDSKEVSAQFGLGKKSSLRVGSQGSGMDSASIRRSIGKGWYLDTSVNKSTGLNDTQERNYGVLLERIIAY